MGVRWGVLGTGNIAAQFATDLALYPEGQITAVGSRSLASADRFADRFAITGRHGDYRSLVADKNVDAVYVATPHTLHEECALLAIELGKPVLVEKPFTINAAQASRVIAAARDRKVFVMEAMWTRFLPHITLLRELINQGLLGDIRSLTADFGELFPFDPEFRAFDPVLAGGALLDLAVYPISLASMILGAPQSLSAVSTFTTTGVDAQTAVTLLYDDGRMAVVFASIEAKTATRASVNGTLARLEIEGDFLAPATMHLIGEDGSSREYSVPHEGRGLRHQVIEVERCIGEGLLESPVMSLDETLQIMMTMDEARRQIGLSFPSDRE
jgi:predicted dehydrogenase